MQLQKRVRHARFVGIMCCSTSRIKVTEYGSQRRVSDLAKARASTWAHEDHVVRVVCLISTSYHDHVSIHAFLQTGFSRLAIVLELVIQADHEYMRQVACFSKAFTSSHYLRFLTIRSPPNMPHYHETYLHSKPPFTPMPFPSTRRSRTI